MIFINKMKNLKIYKTKTFLPTVDGDKKKGSAILLMSPNYEASNRMMNSDLFINSMRFNSYYIERDVSYYINSKNVEELEESAIINEQIELQTCLEYKKSELDDEDFGVPSKRKFPLDTEKHVRSAIKFFNYVDPEDEEELADRIIKAMKKFNIYGKINVSEKNRFSKYYYPKQALEEAVRESESSYDMISEGVDIPKYHGILSQLDLYYHAWNNNIVDEKTAREKIFSMMSNNLCTDNEINSPTTVPTPDEYFAKRGILLPKKESYVEDVLSEHMIKYLPEDCLNIGDKVLFFNESQVNDTRLKRLLYQSRIRYRKDLLNLLDKVKEDNKWIKWAYPELKKYIRRNVFVDLYFYNSVFFQNNTWTLKKGMNLYLDFMDRLVNHPNLKSNGYNKKTIFIPVIEWDTRRDGSVWNFRSSINPISCIYQLMFTNMTQQLKNTFGDIDVVFLGKNNYFKISFSQIDPADIKKLSIKFKMFCIKICKGEEFDAEDIDSSNDNKEDTEVIATKLADKLELTKGIDITPKLNKALKDKAELKNKNPEDLEAEEKEKLKDMENSLTKTSNNTKQDAATKARVLTKQLSASDNGDNGSSDNTKDEDMEKLAKAIADASDNNDTEEDAEDDTAMNNDEINSILASLGNDDEVEISQSRQDRMDNIDDELLDKEVKGKKIKDIIAPATSSGEKEVTTVNVDSPNKEEWANLTYMNFDKNYDIDRDIINIFRMFKNCSRPVVIRNINVTDNSTSEDRLALYDVDMEDYRGKRFNIKLDIPIMEDNRFLLRGSNKSVQTQFFNMPIIKTDLGTCQLISNYKKIFLYRFKDNRGTTLPAVAKFIKAANKYKGNKIKFTYGDNTKVCSKYVLPIDYIDLGGVFNTIETKDWIIYFNQDDIRSKYTIEEGKGFPFAYNKKINAVEYFPYEIVDPFINMVCLNCFGIDSDFEDLFASVTRPSGCAFARASIMSSKIPVIVICGYHIGLRATMDRAKITYSVVDKLSKEIKLDVNKDWIEFGDGYVVYDVNYESSLIMSGLKECATDLYSIGDMDNKEMYLEFLDNYGGRIKADGLDNFRDLFVDPMVKESLEYYGFPTDYIDILLYGSTLLHDNHYIKHTDTSSRKLRRYQLIAVYAYQALSTAYGYYANSLKHSRQAATFAVKQSAVVDLFLLDTITSDDSCINALRDVETTNAITTKGPSGMNADRSYTLDKRAYDDSMLNVLGMSTGFAGNVGITRQTTINANIDHNGYVHTKTEDDEMNDANTLTATEALIPFGSTRDDPMRTAMSFIQTSKHMVRTEDSDPLLVTNGADEVMPYMTTNKFAFKAKKDGIIKSIDESHILIEYIDGTKEYISLEETIEKNSDGGYYVPLKLDADPKLKANSRVKKDQIVAYDKYSFSNKLGEGNNLAYNIGKLTKVAILNTDDGFEDSGVITQDLAEKMATRVDIKFDSVINKDATLYTLVKVGDHVEASQPLIIWEDAFDDEDSADVVSALSDGDMSELGKRKLVSEITGTVTAIKIYRTVEIEELSESLKKVVKAYEKPYKNRADVLKANGLSIAGVPAHYVLPPTGKLKRAQEAILIEIYIEYLDTVGVGDKVVYNAANKAVEKMIIPKGKEPYTAFRPNEKIGCILNESSISKRLVSSSIIYGSIQKAMIELDRSVKDIMDIPYDESTL